jgi:hypothetical protein
MVKLRMLTRPSDGVATGTLMGTSRQVTQLQVATTVYPAATAVQPAG